MDIEKERTNLLLQILEHLITIGPGRPLDFQDRVACVRAYVRLSSMNPDQAIDRYLTSTSTGALFKIHLPAGPEGFLSQLILPIITQAGLKVLCELMSTLNGCLQDQAIRGHIKFGILNVENRLLRNAVIAALPPDDLTLGRQYCRIRRGLVLHAMDYPLEYFRPEDVSANEPVLWSLYGLYVDTERDLYLRLGRSDAVMPFYDVELTAVRDRRQTLLRVFRSAVVANQRAALITVGSMREKLDQYRESLNGADMDHLDRMIDYDEGGQDDGAIQGLTIQLAHPTFRGTNQSDIYTLLRFVIPVELKSGIPEAAWVGDSPIGRCRVTFRRISSVFEDPMMAFLSNIESEKIGDLPSNFLSDVNPTPGASSTLVSLAFDACLALDFEITTDGVIVERSHEDEKALRGGWFFPYKEEAVKLLRARYREASDQFPLNASLDDLHIDLFSNCLVEWLVKPGGDRVGNVVVHQKSYLLTSRDALARARMRYANKIGELYRRDAGATLKALLENATVRTNESLRDFVYKTLELTAKDWIEFHSCWRYLWVEEPKRPRSETEVHPLIDSYLRTVLELKGIRVSREPRTANGAVDFFCSFTTPRDDVLKVCIEVKNAHSGGLEDGVTKQLPAYMDGEHTRHGIYLVMWYRDLDWPEPHAFKSIEEMRTRLEAVKPAGDYSIDVMIINCAKPIPPSKK